MNLLTYLLNGRLLLIIHKRSRCVGHCIFIAVISMLIKLTLLRVFNNVSQFV